MKTLTDSMSIFIKLLKNFEEGLLLNIFYRDIITLILKPEIYSTQKKTQACIFDTIHAKILNEITMNLNSKWDGS